MAEQQTSILSHVSIGTNNFAAALAFYEGVLATLGCRIVMQHPGAVAFGKDYPEFWVQTPYNGKPATTGNGVHIGFLASSPDAVRAFFSAALAAGGTEDGEPGPRHEYGEPYFGCFVRDLDGNKIEAAFWDTELALRLGIG